MFTLTLGQIFNNLLYESNGFKFNVIGLIMYVSLNMHNDFFKYLTIFNHILGASGSLRPRNLAQIE